MIRPSDFWGKVGGKSGVSFFFSTFKTLTIFLVVTGCIGHWRNEADSVLTRSLFSFVGFLCRVLGGWSVFEPRSSTRTNEDDDITRLLLSQAGQREGGKPGGIMTFPFSIACWDYARFLFK